MNEFFEEKVILETDRLILRPVTKEDKLDLFNNISHDKDVLKYFICEYNENIGDFKLELMIEKAIMQKRYFFCIVLKENMEAIGMILNCTVPSSVTNSTEIGYAIGKKYWNKGYTTEALTKMIEFMFSKGVHRVEAKYLEGNIASGCVMKKCGMAYEGMLNDEVYYHDRYFNTYVYSIINKE